MSKDELNGIVLRMMNKELIEIVDLGIRAPCSRLKVRQLFYSSIGFVKSTLLINLETLKLKHLSSTANPIFEGILLKVNWGSIV